MIPKFRVWLKEYNKYFPVSKFSFHEICLVGVKMGVVVVYFQCPTEADLEMFSTHLDKNKKEIYEGDVVEIISKLEDGEYLRVRMIVKMNDWTLIKILEEKIDSVEVIGNIHENN
jgi:uncharacterized phage protein (TIGR01671 family)